MNSSCLDPYLRHYNVLQTTAVKGSGTDRRPHVALNTVRVMVPAVEQASSTAESGIVVVEISTARDRCLHQVVNRFHKAIHFDHHLGLALAAHAHADPVVPRPSDSPLALERWHYEPPGARLLPGNFTIIRLHRCGVPTPMVPNVLRLFQR
jgi:hypothetical protein